MGRRNTRCPALLAAWKVLSGGRGPPSSHVLRAQHARPNHTLRVCNQKLLKKVWKHTEIWSTRYKKGLWTLDLRLRRCRGFSLCLFKYPCALFQILKKKRKNALMSIIFTQNKFKTLQSRQWYYSNIPWIHYIKHEILSLNNVCFSFQCFWTRGPHF